MTFHSSAVLREDARREARQMRIEDIAAWWERTLSLCATAPRADAHGEVLAMHMAEAALRLWASETCADENEVWEATGVRL